MHPSWFRRTSIIALTLSLLAPLLAAAQNLPPLVIAVHGIGGGNRPDGWSNSIANTWGVPVNEVTFTLPARTLGDSYTDFASHAGDWALTVQHRIQDLVRANPGRRVVIVSHSWGTVVTKMAFSGGVGGGNSTELSNNDYAVNPINLEGAQVDDWVTLGSPLGRDTGTVPLNINQLNLDVPAGRPGIVKRWTNFYDVDDPVSSMSHNLEGARNVELHDSGDWDESWVKLPFVSPHAGVWRNPVVVEKIKAVYRELTAPARLPQQQLAAGPPPVAPPAAPATQASPEGIKYQRLAAALVKINELDVQRRNRERPGYHYSISYYTPPTAQYKGGAWYIVAAWVLKQQDPGVDRVYDAFQRGDANTPQWLTVSEVASWVARYPEVTW